MRHGLKNWFLRASSGWPQKTTENGILKLKKNILDPPTPLYMGSKYSRIPMIEQLNRLITKIPVNAEAFLFI